MRYHISRDDIFDYHPIRECNIYFIIPNIRSFIFYRLRPTVVSGVPKSLLSICMNEKTSFTKMVLLSSFNDRLIMTFGQTNNVIKSRRRQTLYKAASFKWETVQDVVWLQNRNFRQIGSNLVSTCSSCPN